MIRLHCLQHVPFEGLGHLEKWIHQQGYPLTYTRFYQRDRLPEPDDFDCLIVLGGPMGVGQQEAYPWLAEEKALIRTCIQLNKKVLGICLGAQLIAAALGARVYPNVQKEIGWFPVTMAPSFQALVPEAPLEELMVFHWHGDTFDLPAGLRMRDQPRAFASLPTPTVYHRHPGTRHPISFRSHRSHRPSHARTWES